MINSLRFKNFKSFAEAELKLGPFTVLVGANASGKSNVRDAFRFLHGIGRGYLLAEILGEKRGDGGELQWTGIRGGTREIAYNAGKDFSVSACFERPPEEFGFGGLPHNHRQGAIRGEYEIRVSAAITPRVLDERMYVDIEHEAPLRIKADSSTARRGLSVAIPSTLMAVLNRSKLRLNDDRQPALSQLLSHFNMTDWERGTLRHATGAFSSMRFLELSPEAMREPSLPGQTVLGDRGENLSSVLQELWETPQLRAALVSWLQALTPMDVAELDFVPDAAGRVLVVLVEADGRRISALSASDGTLRFLALLAALLGPEPARFYFIEELENGIHPTRLHLLAQLIEQETARGKTQVVATTHSPQLLTMLNETSRQHATLAYRLEQQPDTHLRRILDIPYAAEVMEKQDLGNLHSFGWLEDAVFFADAGTPA